MIYNIVKDLQKEHEELSSRLLQVSAAIQALTNNAQPKKAKRFLSKDARARIAAAQRLRWAKVKRHNKMKPRVLEMRRKAA